MMSKPRSGSSAARNRRLALLFTAVVGLGFLFVRTCSGPPALAMHHDVLADASVLSATVVAGPAVCNVTRALEDFTLSPFSSDHREEIAPLLPALCTTECLKSTPAKGAAVTAAAPCPAAKPCSCPKASPCPSTNIPSVMKRPAPAVPGDLGVSTPGAVGGVEVVPQPLPPPVVLPPTNARTEFKCFQSSDWAEICVYNLLCMDGNKVVFIDDRKRPNEPVPSHYGVGDNPQGSHVFDVNPLPPPGTKGLPLNTRVNAYYQRSSALANAEWTNRAMWVLEPEYRGWEVQHIFFFSHVVFPLWEAQQSNASWGGAMPPIQDVHFMVNRKFKMNDWGNGVMETLLPADAKLGFLDDLAAYSPEKLRCSTRGVLMGSKPNVFSGMKPAFNFRAAVYKRFDIPVLRQPPKRLIVFNRANAGRRFENMDEMEALFKRYDIPYEVMLKHGTFEEQVRTMSRAGVLMLAHGAAATNTMFQQTRSAFIEVFPYLRKRFGFMNVAQVSGNFYYPLFTWKKSLTGKTVMNETQFMNECDDLPSIVTNRVSACDAAQKVVTIHVDIVALERLLIDAFDSIGYRIHPVDGKRFEADVSAK